MRRPFPRTSGSPQATPIVETPAHYAPTLFWSLALLSEVVIGSVEPTMSCVSCETRCKDSQKSPHCYRLIWKSAKLYVILAENCSDWKEIVDFRLNSRLKNGWTKTGRLQRKMKTDEMRDLRPSENLTQVWHLIIRFSCFPVLCDFHLRCCVLQTFLDSDFSEWHLFVL